MYYGTKVLALNVTLYHVINVTWVANCACADVMRKWYGQKSFSSAHITVGTFSEYELYVHLSCVKFLFKKMLWLRSNRHFFVKNNRKRCVFCYNFVLAVQYFSMKLRYIVDYYRLEHIPCKFQLITLPRNG